MTTSDKVNGSVWKVAKLLCACEGNDKTIDIDDVMDLINSSGVFNRNEMLSRVGNIFFYNQATHQLGFQSRAMQYYLQQELEKMDKKKVLK